MSMIQLLIHPKEAFFKHYLVITTLFLFVLIPIGKMFFEYQIFSQHPWIQTSGYPPFLMMSCWMILNWTMNGLITYILLTHSVKKNRNGLLTFFTSSQSLRLFFCILSIVFQNRWGMHSMAYDLSKAHFFVFYLVEFVLNPAWLYFAWSVRRINQLNQIRESIANSPEAMQHLQNLENPTSTEMVDQVMNYLNFRLPPSQQKLIIPLKIEAVKRLQTATALI